MRPTVKGLTMQVLSSSGGVLERKRMGGVGVIKWMLLNEAL